jgi:hypothetical protein
VHKELVHKNLTKAMQLIIIGKKEGILDSKEETETEKKCEHIWVYESEEQGEDNCNFLIFEWYKCKLCGKKEKRLLGKLG